MGSERGRTAIALIAAAALVGVLVLGVIGPRGGASPSGSPSAGASSTSAPSTGTATATGSAVAASPSPSATSVATSAPSSAAPPTPAPTASPTPAASATATGRDLSGTWSGTWTNVTPDQATGVLEVTWTQQGSNLDGTVAFDSPCSNATGVQGTVTGAQVEFSAVGRDEVEFKGLVAGSRIVGTFTSSCDSSAGGFELTKAP